MELFDIHELVYAVYSKYQVRIVIKMRKQDLQNVRNLLKVVEVMIGLGLKPRQVTYRVHYIPNH